MTQQTYFDSAGQPLKLGRPVGSGGEGDVFELSGGIPRVVKIYRKSLTQTSQEKYAAMARMGDPEILKVAAWPLATAHSSARGPVCGIVMPLVSGFAEIHSLYSPAQRNADFPKADWQFLLHAAINSAIAVEVVHSKGHVVGDVNQSNVLVSHDATVRLIDTDSFQVRENGRSFRCEVGVAPFTPPELQGKRFREFDRTRNHDYFGLAVLIFHLLFMGRHPFAGVAQDRTDLTLERAIHEGRFAYGKLSTVKKVARPPGSMALNLVPDYLAQLFEQAFHFDGQPPNRPSTTQWIDALQKLSSSLRTCKDYSSHRVPIHLHECPWCLLVQSGQPDFFIAASLSRGQASCGVSFDIDGIWRAIDLIKWRDLIYSVPSAHRARQSLAHLQALKPQPLPPFKPFAEPPYELPPPEPDAPEYATLPSLCLFSPTFVNAVIPEPPPQVQPLAVSPPSFWPKPELRKLPRAMAQKLLAAIVVGSAVLGPLGFVLGIPFMLYIGIISLPIFSIWWLVLETQRPEEWNEDLRDRLRVWQAECETIRETWNAQVRKNVEAAAKENQRRWLAWTAEKKRLEDIAAAQNQMRQQVADADNQRRRIEWAEATRPIEAANQVLREQWQAKMWIWRNACEAVEMRNLPARNAWNLQNERLRKEWLKTKAVYDDAIQRLQNEIARREKDFRALINEASAIEKRWREVVADKEGQFCAMKRTLSEKKGAYCALRADFDRELRDKEKNKRELQQDQFLRKHLIAASGLSGLGPKRIAPLISFGIESAADVHRLSSQPVPGFGTKRIAQLQRWRDSVLRKFVFQPGQAISVADLTALQRKYAPRMSPLESQLANGANGLQRIIREAESQLQPLRDQLNGIYDDVAVLQMEIQALKE